MGYSYLILIDEELSSFHLCYFIVLMISLVFKMWNINNKWLVVSKLLTGTVYEFNHIFCLFVKSQDLSKTFCFY